MLKTVFVAKHRRIKRLFIHTTFAYMMWWIIYCNYYLMEYIENNTCVLGNTRFISSVEHDISRVSAANE